MGQVITNAFEQYWQSSLAAEQPVVLDEFVLADIPNLDITAPIDPDTGLPPESQIVHRQTVDQRGRVNNNAVAYSIVMDTTVGDFSFNAMFLRNKANGVIGMIVYKGRETKLKTDQTTGQTGNSLVKSMLMGYDQAAEATLTHVDAGTWQIDYAARLRGQDEDLRQLASQLYGHHTFIGDGFKVVQQDGAYQVTQGVAIVGGLRIELKQPEVIYPGTKPIGVWVDVHRAGSLLSEHQNHFTIITSVADLTDHVDSSGYPHYVAKLATVQANNTIVDGRGNTSSGETSIPDALARLELADATLSINNREAIRRSYAKAGYNLVKGSFEAGGTLANTNDLLLHEASGKAYSGPVGNVNAGTNPSSVGFIDNSGVLPRVISTVTGVSTGMFAVGTRLELSDRNGALFTVVSGDTTDGIGTISAGIGKTAQYEWTQPTAGDPRHFGGRRNDDTFDSTAAVKYAANNKKIYFDGVYAVSDEIVIKSDCVIRCIGKSGLRAKKGAVMTGKAVCRASALPIGTTPNMKQEHQQVRSISQSGQLYIDANNIADFAFYGRGISAESELDFVVGEKANVCGVALLTSWFLTVKTGLFGLNSGINIAIGTPIAGETGDLFVNGVHFPMLDSYKTNGTTGVTYNQDGAAAEQKAGAGILLGLGFGNRISTLVSQSSHGANLVCSKTIGFSIGSVYVENGSTSTPSRKTSILLASDNNDNSTLPINLLHLEAGQQILNRSTSLLLDIHTAYRYDNVKSLDTACIGGSIKIKEPSYYVRNAYSNIPPDALSYERTEQEVHITGPVDSATAPASRLFTKWLFRKGSHRLRVKLSAVSTTPVTINLTSDGTTEAFNVTDALDIGLSGSRTDGSWYTINIGAPTGDAGIKATIAITRKTTSWDGI